MHRPPSSIRAFGRPPIRTLLPPAWMTPVTLILCAGDWQSDGTLPDNPRRVHGHVEDRRGLAPPRRSALQDEVDLVRGIGEHPLRRRRWLEAPRGRTPRCPPPAP